MSKHHLRVLTAQLSLQEMEDMAHGSQADAVAETEQLQTAPTQALERDADQVDDEATTKVLAGQTPGAVKLFTANLIRLFCWLLLSPLILNRTAQVVMSTLKCRSAEALQMHCKPIMVPKMWQPRTWKQQKIDPPSRCSQNSLQSHQAPA